MLEKNQENKANLGGFFVDTLIFPIQILLGAIASPIIAKFKIIIAIVVFIVALLLIFVFLTGNNQKIAKSQADSSSSSVRSFSSPNILPDGSKVLNVPYFNQYLDSNGRINPSDGWKMCGAASAVMIAGYYKKLPYKDESDLKKYMYQDMNQNLPNYCFLPRYGGAFGVTSDYTNCQLSTSNGIRKYLGLYSLKTSQLNANFNSIKASIDSGRPLIFSTTFPFDHIAVIKGYTPDGKLIMNDPFKNTQDGSYMINGVYFAANGQTNNYSYNGKDAIYDLNYSVASRGLSVLYLYSIYQ